ncbi:hypothetical protein LOTGIDRAFT_142546, partial [Lottia gigantea]
PYQKSHIDSTIPNITHRQYHTKHHTKTAPYQKSHIDSTILNITHRQHHTKNHT